MDDVWGVDDSCVAGPVHLSCLLVLSLQRRPVRAPVSVLAIKSKCRNLAVEVQPRAQHESDLTEDVSGVPGPHEVWGVCRQSQHALALDLLLQCLLVLSL